MSIDNLAALKNEVENTFGKKILSSTHCIQLSLEISRKTGATISVNTLRRIFNLMKSIYQPSLFTLDLLSKYCGYTSYNNFTSPVYDGIKTSQASDTENWLLDMLTFPFKNNDVKGISNSVLLPYITELINNLGNYGQVIEKFHKEMAKTAKGQRIYFEQFVNIDALNSYYGRGLKICLQENTAEEAQLFSHSLLCMKYWLTDEAELLEDHYSYLSGNTSDIYARSINVQARIYSAKLFMGKQKASGTGVICREIRAYHEKIKDSIFINPAHPSFEFIIAEALVLIECYDSALYFIDEAIRKEKRNHSAHQVENNHLESLQLFKAIALVNMGEEEKARGILARISTNKFYFLSKQLNLILYLNLKKHFSPTDKLETELDALVLKTGFKRFKINSLVVDNVKSMN